MAKTDAIKKKKGWPASLSLGKIKSTLGNKAFWSAQKNKAAGVYQRARTWIRSKPILGRIGGFIALLLGEVTALLLGLVCIWMFAISGFLAKGTADLSIFRPDAQRWFQGAFEGHSADVGLLKLDWNFAQNSIIFHAEDITVYDAQREAIEYIKRIESEHALEDVMRGKVDLIRLYIDGGEASFVRGADGDMIAGLGRPNTVGSLGPVWRGEAEGERPTPFQNSRLKEVELTNVQIHIADAQDGMNWRLDNTELSVLRTDKDLEFSAQTVISTLKDTGDVRLDSEADFAIEGRISRDLQDIDSALKLSHFTPSHFMPKRGRFSALRALNAPLNLETDMAARRGPGLEGFNVLLDVGKGQMLSPSGAAPLKHAKLTAHYGPETQKLDVKNIDVQSNRFAVKGQAEIGNIQSPLRGLLKQNTEFDITLASLLIDRTPQFSAPFKLEDVVLTGAYDRENGRANFAKIYGDFGRFQPDFSGLITHDKQRKITALKLDGPILGELTPEDVLGIWPPNAAQGAREWIERSVMAGTLSNVKLSLDLNEVDFAQMPPLPRDSARVSFDYKNGAVRYISTMTPATDVFGSGVLHGNSGDFVLKSARVGDVELTQGTIDIPVFFPKGGDLNIDVDGVGPLTQLVALIDQEPFQYASPYGVKPEDFSGTGAINLKVTRPLLVHFDRSRIHYTVSGHMHDVSAPFGVGPHKLRDGNVTLFADKDGLVMQGPARIGAWNTDVSWREIFDEGATPTLYSISGILDRDALDGFGIGLREYIGGDIKLNIDARARGLEITGADVSADLSQTEMRLGPYWSKPIGVEGRMTGQLSRGTYGRVKLRDMDIVSPGLSVKGGLDIAGDFRLINLDFSTAKIANFVDAALQVKPNDAGDKFDIFLTGDYLDLSPFVSGMFNAQSNAFDVPILLTASLRRLALNEAYSLRDSNVLFAHDGTGIRQARLKGDTLDGALVVDITTDDKEGVRHIDIDVPSASEAAYAFMGLSSLIGGRMQIKGTMPAVGELGPMSGEAFVEDITIVNAPAMTTLLSLASLRGLADAMSGQGLKFQSLTVPFSIENQVLSMRDARASGPALGMTANGEVSFMDKTLDLDGVLVPAYTANSLLGDIPVIGDIFVGKKGEGIFALSYAMKGPFSKSQVSVNPLSALTPGFLRGIFRQKRDALPPSVLEKIEAVRPEGALEDEAEGGP